MKIVHSIDDKGREKGCPTGHCCDNCNLYRPTYQRSEGGDITQVWDCQWNNLALLMSESKSGVERVQKAVESARNESTKRQDEFNRIAGTARDTIQIEARKRLESGSVG